MGQLQLSTILYELRTRFRLGGTYRGLHIGFGGDLLGDILQIYIRAHVRRHVTYFWAILEPSTVPARLGPRVFRVYTPVESPEP